MQVTIFTANCIGQAANCSYPNKVTVVTPEQLREAVKADHVCAEYKGNYRGIGNFIRSDVIVMDIDNDHSEEPAEWITAEKLEEIFPDMEYMLASSRHHLLPKEGKSARPRYHIYFPISEITDAEMYGNLKKALQKEYPFFDGNALDAARFIFGADCEEVLVHDGWMTIDEEIDVSQVAEEEDFDSEDSESASGGQILEGSRNNTMRANIMAKIQNPTKVITGVNTRWSYANVWDAKSINGGAPKYSVSLIIPKSDTVTVNKIKAAIEAAYEEGQSKLKGNGKTVPTLSILKTPLRDGDLERPDDPAYANAYFINANSASAPGIVDADRQPILERSEVYSGVYGRASINLYAFNSNGNKGIACGLNNLQKIRDGEPLGGKSRAEDDFASD